MNRPAFLAILFAYALYLCIVTELFQNDVPSQRSVFTTHALQVIPVSTNMCYRPSHHKHAHSVMRQRIPGACERNRPGQK